MSGMNGSFTSGAGAAISPYGSSASGGVSSSAQGYPSSGKARMHSSPLYGGNQRSSPIGGDHHHQQQQHGTGSYVSYGYPGSGPSTGVPSLSPRHHYSSFSPQLTSPSAGGGGGAGSGGYAASQGAPNGSMNHLRSASAQQYGSRRQGW